MPDLDLSLEQEAIDTLEKQGYVPNLLERIRQKVQQGLNIPHRWEPPSSEQKPDEPKQP